MDARAVTHEPLDDALLGLLGEWLRGRRWFPAKGVAAELTCVGGLTLVDPLDEADVRIVLVRTAAPGVDTVLQVPLVLRAPGGDHAEQTIGTLGADAPRGGRATSTAARTDVVDGAGDPAFLRSWLAAAEGLGADVDPSRAQVLTGEQSNTSVLLPGSGQGGSGSAIIKVFRALAPGANPDVDVPRALADAGWENVPRPLAWLEATWPSGASTVTGHLGVVSAFVPGARDGFELACAMAGRGEPFADLARELGEVVAGMHDALGRALPVAAPQAGADRASELAGALRRRFDWAVAAVPQLRRYADRVAALAAGTQAVREPPAPQRVHGDLHLGQVLRGRDRWYVLDFEGEPLAPIAARTRPDLALRDVAGMLRSIDYAAAVGGAGGAGGDVDDGGTERTWTPAGADLAWAEQARVALLDGYLHGSPVDGGTAILLQALELDKALYEAVYEARNRPHWLGIPLAALDRLLPQPTPQPSEPTTEPRP
ncbi:aminoglycoside phosphotransferase [Cellulomonas sp. WB94]|uniref:maltokinase N-terminal cap-like domain-containing protein n=1 Tax=Cellulomonas sp. WB94 TaxID=2173174 RepID=UPI000D5863D5|nr:phosphotransferase [Cellulomonas sp. WB94]PVU83675.1 aminoglycoside phosphotransferase [Cellulomonas sp. WB94]